MYVCEMQEQYSKQDRVGRGRGLNGSGEGKGSGMCCRAHIRSPDVFVSLGMMQRTKLGWVVYRLAISLPSCSCRMTSHSVRHLNRRKFRRKGRKISSYMSKSDASGKQLNTRSSAAAARPVKCQAQSETRAIPTSDPDRATHFQSEQADEQLL